MNPKRLEWAASVACVAAAFVGSGSLSSCDQSPLDFGAGGSHAAATHAAATSADVSTMSGSVAASAGATAAGSTGSGGVGGGGAAAAGAVSVTMQHDDNLRSGANLKETVLTPANVGGGAFGMLFARAVDDQIYAQPLVLPPAWRSRCKGTHNVVYVATMSDSVYAFDARDPAAGAPLWQDSFIDPAHGVVPVDTPT